MSVQKPAGAPRAATRAAVPPLLPAGKPECVLNPEPSYLAGSLSHSVAWSCCMECLMWRTLVSAGLLFCFQT